MNKIITILILCIGFSLSTQAQKAKRPNPYFKEQQLPNGVKYLPAPPDTTSTQFTNDIAQYMWGKSQRQGARGRQAIDHATMSVDDMIRLFSPAFGMTISREETPELYRLLGHSIETLRRGTHIAKRTYMRKRPYSRFNEPSLVPRDEEWLRNNGSYPSGHTTLGWGMALLLSEINPERQDTLLKLGYEWGQSRVIAGYHWQSDVDTGRLIGSACYARLHTSAGFLKQLEKAKSEFRRKWKH